MEHLGTILLWGFAAIGIIVTVGAVLFIGAAAVIAMNDDSYDTDARTA